VFLFKYGKKIFDKLNEAMNPEFADEDALNPFDFWEGANFKLKIRNVEGYRNYDKSEFAKSSALFEDDDEMEVVWKKQHSLQEFISPSKFKSYDELKAKLNKVLGLDKAAVMQSVRESAAVKVAAAKENDVPWAEEIAQPEFKSKSAIPMDDDDDGLEFFKKLAK